MLSVAPASDALAFDAATLLSEAFEGDGATSAEHSREPLSGDEAAEEKTTTKRFSLVETVKKSVAKSVEGDGADEEVDDAADSDYRPDEEEEDMDEDDDDEEDDEEEDDEAYLQSLEAQLDEHADEVGDYYLRRMLEKRATLEGDEAKWVDSYIARQRKWKETHGTSIDEMDLDLLRPRARSSKLHAAWNGRVSPRLPLALRDQPAEFLLSLVAVALFVGVALAVQFYVAFRAPQYS